MNENDSEISGLQRLGPTLEKLIGPPPGETGSARLTINEAEARARLLSGSSAEATDQALCRWLMSSLGVEVFVEMGFTFPVGGGYRRLARYVKVGGRTDRMTQAAAAAQALLTRPTHDQCEEWLAALEASTAPRKRSDVGASLALAVYAAELRRYPADVAREACMSLARSQPFFPSLSELVAVLNRIGATRRLIVAALKEAAA